MPNLKNYTSKVPVDRSVRNIEKLLINCGAFEILKEYKDGNLIYISFNKKIDTKVFHFRIPANVDAVYRVLLSGRTQHITALGKDKLYQQASRTAWRTAHEWVQIQLSYIEMEQAEFMQLFMSHLLVVGKNNIVKPYYEVIKDSEFKDLTLIEGRK